MQSTEIAPLFSCRFSGGPATIASAADDLINGDGRLGDRIGATPEMRAILSLAFKEILQTICDIAGEQTVGDASSIELWVERALMIVCVKFRGAPLPDWLLTNWDRAQEPAVLAPEIDAGWGWVIVREALDTVSHDWRGSEQLLFLEKRF